MTAVGDATLSSAPSRRWWQPSVREVAVRLALLGYTPAEVALPRPVPAGRPTVSVVVPCYNYGRYLRLCVRTILEQRGVDVDVLIVDDASTDDTAEVAADLAASDSRVRFIRHEVNRGHIATYNEGLALVEGTYVLLLSADDALPPGALERGAALMEAHPSVGLAYGCLVKFEDGTELPAARTDALAHVIWRGQDWLTDVLATGNNPITNQALMRTEVLRRVGPFRSDLPHSADYLMWLRAAAASDVGLLLGADQAYHRQHSASMSRTVYAGDLRDLGERRRAVDVLVDDSACPPAAPDRLRALSRRALAHEALHRACAALETQRTSEPVEGYAAFARETLPEIDGSSRWRAYQRRSTSRGRSLRLRYQARRVLVEQYRHVRFIRLHWVGVY